jgi:hypothetical protein
MMTPRQAANRIYALETVLEATQRELRSATNRVSILADTVKCWERRHDAEQARKRANDDEESFAEWVDRREKREAWEQNG